MLGITKKIILFFYCFNISLLFAEVSIPVFKIKEVQILDCSSTINPATFNYLKEGLAKAKEKGMGLVLIKLNTPGGLVSTTKDIVSLIASSSLPIVIWIGPEGASATSAGAIISSASPFLMMAQGTNIGAATPVEAGGDIVSKDLKSKATNDLKALVRSLAQTHGRNGEAFEEMIVSAKSFDNKQALEQKVIEGLANSEIEVVRALHQKKWRSHKEEYILDTSEAILREFEMDLGQKILNTLAHPQLSYIFFILGAMLLYFELQAPGGFVAGGVGLLSLILSGIGFQVLPLNFGALGLIILSFVLFILELYVTSFGLLTMGGLASLTFGSLFLFRSENSYLELGLPVIISTVLGIAFFISFILFYWWREDKKNKVQSDVGNKMEGKSAQISSFLSHAQDGKFYYFVKINGEMWKAEVSEECQIGDWVSVVKGPSSELILSVKK